MTFLNRGILQVFKAFWVVAIDNSEYIDDESWVLLSILLKLNLTFIVATMGLRSLLNPVAMEVLQNPKIKVIQMKIIDKWYHVGLACQMLDVDAIPPELEKYVLYSTCATYFCQSSRFVISDCPEIHTHRLKLFC